MALHLHFCSGLLPFFDTQISNVIPQTKAAIDEWTLPLLQVFSADNRFAENKALMASKDSKRIVKIYNKVARALIEFETLWTQAWIRSIESAKAGLQSTLIVRHPTTGEHV